MAYFESPKLHTLRRVVDEPIPTNLSTISVPQNPSIDKFYVAWKRLSRDLDALKL